MLAQQIEVWTRYGDWACHALLTNLDKLVKGTSVDGEFLLCTPSWVPKEPRLVANGSQIIGLVGHQPHEDWKHLVQIKQSGAQGGAATLAQLLATLKEASNGIPAPPGAQPGPQPTSCPQPSSIPATNFSSPSRFPNIHQAQPSFMPGSTPRAVQKPEGASSGLRSGDAPAHNPGCSPVLILSDDDVAEAGGVETGTETSLLPHSSVKVYVQGRQGSAVACKFAIWVNPMSVLQGEGCVPLFLLCKDSRYSIDPASDELTGEQLLAHTKVKTKQWSEVVHLAEGVTWRSVIYVNDTSLSKLLRDAQPVSVQHDDDAHEVEPDMGGVDSDDNDDDYEAEEEVEEEEEQDSDGSSKTLQQMNNERRIKREVTKAKKELQELLRKEGCPWIEDDWHVVAELQRKQVLVTWSFRGNVYKTRKGALRAAIEAHRSTATSPGKGGPVSTKKRASVGGADAGGSAAAAAAAAAAPAAAPAKKARTTAALAYPDTSTTRLVFNPKTGKTNVIPVTSSQQAEASKASLDKVFKGSTSRGWPKLPIPEASHDQLQEQSEAMMLSNLVKLFNHLGFQNAAKNVTIKWAACHEASKAARDKGKRLVRVYLQLVSAVLLEDVDSVKELISNGLELQP